MQHVATDWSVRGLRQRCRSLRAHLVERQLASAEELADYWPGGEENPHAGRGAWIYAYANYVRLAGRADRRLVADEGVAAEQLVQSALAARAMPVQGDGVPAGTAVHPKSFNALQHAACIDRRLRTLLAMQRVLAEAPGEDAMRAYGAVVLAVTEQQLLLAWLATHPGPGVPWDWAATPWDGAGPEVPGWLRALAPEVVSAIGILHITVNVARLRALDALTTPRQVETPTGWSTFFASASVELGQDVERLMRERPLATVVAQSALVAEQHRRAQAAMEARP